MDIDEIISHWMPNDFTYTSQSPKNLDEARLIVDTHPEVSCLAITKHDDRYLFTEILCANKTCINRSRFLFDNIKNIILANSIKVSGMKFIFHFKGDACEIQQNNFPLLANSRSPSNRDIILWPLCIKKNVFFHEEINRYLKNIDTIKWDSKKSIFIFRGMNSGNPFSCVQYLWNKDRASRCDLLLESLRLPSNLQSIVDVGFNKLYPNHFKLFLNKNNTNYLQKEFGDYLKKGCSVNDLRDELKIIFKKIKRTIKMPKFFEYKYIFCPEGFDCSSSLSWVLASNSLAIVPPFHHENSIISSLNLKPYVHFLPIKEDYSDLSDVINWAITNDEKCKQIVSNANEYMKHFIKKDSVILIQKEIISRLLN